VLHWFGGAHSHTPQPLRTNSWGLKSHGQLAGQAAETFPHSTQVCFWHSEPDGHSPLALQEMASQLHTTHSFTKALVSIRPGGQGPQTPALQGSQLPLHNSPGGHCALSVQVTLSTGTPQSEPPSAALHLELSSTWLGVPQLAHRPIRLHESQAFFQSGIFGRASAGAIRLTQYRVGRAAGMVMSRLLALAALVPETTVPASMAKKPEQTLASSAIEPTPLGGSPSDAELAERLGRDDAWAKEALYRKYVQTIWGLALRLTGNRADAEDVVQDTFAEAMRDAKQLREHTRLRAWLMSVAVHQAHRRFRRRRLLRALGLDREMDASLVDLVAAPDVGAETLSEFRLLGRVLATLAAKDRIAWTLRFVEGCSLSEVAELCACSLATAKRRIAAAQRSVGRHVEVTLPDLEADDG
jgi:RNA polymerase sigma-70 factor, ECF subfamily